MKRRFYLTAIVIGLLLLAMTMTSCVNGGTSSNTTNTPLAVPASEPSTLVVPNTVVTEPPDNFATPAPIVRPEAP